MPLKLQLLTTSRRGRAALLILLAACLYTTTAYAAVNDGKSEWVGLGLAEALERLRAQGLEVIYSTALVRPEMRVVSQPEATSGRGLLEELLAPHGLTAVDGPGGRLLVVRGGVAPPKTPGGVAGRLISKGSGEPVAGAVIRIVGLPGSARSDSDGRFELTGFDSGSYTLVVEADGYLRANIAEVEVDAPKVTRITVELNPKPVFPREVEVTPSRFAMLRAETESRQLLSRSDVDRLPHLADDLLRVTHFLPSAAAGDLSARFSIRGGHPDEVMMMVDGLQIFEPFHVKEFNGVFGMIDSEAISGVDLLAGGFTAEYGDRMSGVMDMVSVTPETNRFSLGASFDNLRVSGKGTFNRGSWLVTARRGYLDWILDVTGVDDFRFSPDYYDVLAKVSCAVGTGSVLSAHLLAGTDSGDYVDVEYPGRYSGGSDMRYLWLNLDTEWSAEVFSRTQVSFGRLDETREGYSNGTYSFTDVSDESAASFLGLRQAWDADIAGHHLLKLGWEIRRVTASYDYASLTRNEDPIFIGLGPPVVAERDEDVSVEGWSFSLHAADRLRLTPKVAMEVGLRWDRQTWVDDGDQISPRVNLVWEIDDRSSLRAAWGRFAQAQGIHELQVKDGDTRFYPAEWAEHRVLSYRRRLDPEYELRIEAYDNRMSDLRPRFENLFEPYWIFAEGRPDRIRVAPDRGEAQGIEISLQRSEEDHWSWRASYVRSSVKDRVGGVWQPRGWDQPHALSLNLSWLPGKSWSLSLAGFYHTGWPTTAVSARWAQTADGAWHIVPVLGLRNGARFPHYARLDLRASRLFRLKRGTLRAFVEVTNLLNRENYRSTQEFRFYSHPDGSIVGDRDDETWLPFLPSFGVVWDF
jgi:outer membrane receptor protein involved in Fe transport